MTGKSRWISRGEWLYRGAAWPACVLAAAGLFAGLAQAGINTGPAGGVSPAATFCATHGVTDQSATRDLAIAVNEIKKRGNAWRDLYDAWIFMTRFNSQSNHLSLLGRPYNFTNDLYYSTQWSGGNSPNGAAQFFGTNVMWTALPNLGPSYTLVVYVRHPAPAIDAFGPAAYALQMQAEVVSTNDGSAVVVPPANDSYGTQFYTASGTNWSDNNASGGPNVTNHYTMMASGAFHGDCGGLGYMRQVIAISVNGNQYTAWIDGKPCAFGNNGSTNMFVSPPLTSAPNLLRLGGGDANWLTNMILPANLLGGNMVGAAMLFTNSIENDSNILAASYSFCSCLEDADTAVSFQGSSIIANSSWAGGITPASGYKPITNDVALLYEQMNPRTLVKQEGAPGSTLAQYTSMGNSWSNGIPFSPAAILDLPAAKFKTRVVKTDAPRNDSPIPGPISAAALGTIITNFNNFYTQYTTNGVAVELIRTPFCLLLSQGTNANLATNNQSWQVICSAIQTNFPLAAVWPMDRYVTWEYLQSASYDQPATHLDMTNIIGHEANKAVAMLVSGRGWPVHYVGGTNLMVNGGTFFWTNYFPYTVTLDISGGAVQGINKGGLALFTTGITNAAFGLPVYPGEVFIITNTVTPVIWEDSTQPQ